MLRDIVEILGLAVGLAGLVQLYRQEEDRRLLLSFAGLFLVLLLGWEVYSAIDRRQEVGQTQERIVNLLRNRPQTIDEITQGLSPNQVPLLRGALDGLLKGQAPVVWFNPKVYLEPSTSI